jgi:hypothetical protein
VVKYLPDPIRDEPINVGVVGNLDGRLVLRMTPKFARVRREAGVSDTSALELGLAFLRSTLDREPSITLVDLVGSMSSGLLRLSEVMGGLADDPWDFIEDQYERYVGDTVTQRTVPATTRRTIRDHLRSAIARRGADSSRFAISKKRFKGATGRHDFDFGFENGKVTLVRGISLETDEAYALRDARELSFAAIDSHKLEDHIGRMLEVIAVVAPPTEPSGAYDEAYGLVQSNVDRYVLLDSPESEIEIGRVLESPDVRPLAGSMLAEPLVGVPA